MARRRLRAMASTVQLPVPIPNGAIGTLFLRIPPTTDRDGWSALAQRITSFGGSYAWWVADLAAFAKHHFEDWNRALDELSQAVSGGRKYIEQLARCGRLYSVSDRIAGLSITHFIYALQHVPAHRRTKVLKHAAAHGISAGTMIDSFIPADKRTFMVIFKIPERHQEADDLEAACSTLAHQFPGTKFRIVRRGKAHPRKIGQSFAAIPRD